MKKRITVLIFLLAIFVGLTFAVYKAALTTMSQYAYDGPNQLLFLPKESKNQLIQGKINSGTITEKLSLSGTVVFESDAITTRAKQEIKNGDCLKVGDIAIILNDKNENSEQLVIAIQDDLVQLLDFSKSYISTQIPVEKQGKIENAEAIQLTFENEIKNSEIFYIHPFVDDEKFEIKLKNPYHAYAGSVVKIEMILGTSTDVVLVPLPFVRISPNGTTYIVEQRENGKTAQYEIEIIETVNNTCILKNAQHLVGKTVIADSDEIALRENE